MDINITRKWGPSHTWNPKPRHIAELQGLLKDQPGWGHPNLWREYIPEQNGTSCHNRVATAAQHGHIGAAILVRDKLPQETHRWTTHHDPLMAPSFMEGGSWDGICAISAFDCPCAKGMSRPFFFTVGPHKRVTSMPVSVLQTTSLACCSGP